MARKIITAKSVIPIPVIRCRFDKMVPIAELKPNPHNPNQHPAGQIATFANILKYQGTRRPFRVSKRSGLMTAGHGQLEAYKLNGWKDAPVEYQDYDDEAQEFADLVADNTLASWAKMDLSAITDIAKQFDGFDVNLLGINGFTLKEPEVEEQQEKSDEKSNSDSEEYLSSQQRKIILTFSLKEFSRITETIGKIMTDKRLESFSDTVKYLVDNYGKNSVSKAKPKKTKRK